MDNIIRSARSVDGFAQINNKMLQDKALSWEARGMLSYIMSLPVNWSLNIQDLVNRCENTGRDKTSRIFNELIEAGYVVKQRARSDGGTFAGWSYTVSDEIINSPIPENPKTVKPKTANPTLVINSNKNTQIKNTHSPLPPNENERLIAAQRKMIEGEKTPLKQLQEKHPDFYPHYEEMLKLSKVFAFSVKLAKTKAFLSQIENHSQDQLITVATKTMATIGNPTYIFQEFFKNLTANHTTAAGTEYENPYDAARARIKARQQQEDKE